MKIGNKILAISLGLSVAFASCKKKEEEETKCTTPATPTATNNSPVNLGGTIQLTAKAVEGATYTWSGPNKFTSTEQNPTVTYSNNNVLGEYSVYATVNGCKSASSFTTVVGCDTPTVSSNSPVAMGGTLTLSAQNIPGATYTWSLVGEPDFTSNESSFSIPSVHDSMAGTYEVAVTYQNCTAPVGRVEVVILPAAPTVSGTTTLTAGATLSLTATSTTSGVTFEWKGPNGFTFIGSNLVINNIGRRDAGEYSVVATKNGLKSAETKKNVVVNFNTTAGCAGTTSVTHNGITYNTVEITYLTTKQCWLRSNLKQSATDSLFSWDELMAVTTVPTAQQGLCPVGWHVASDGEWTILSSAVNNDGNALKKVGQGSGAGAGTNTSGFSAMFGAGPKLFFWTATPTTVNADFIWYRTLEKTTNTIFRDNVKKNPTTGAVPNYNARCIKD